MSTSIDVPVFDEKSIAIFCNVAVVLENVTGVAAVVTSKTGKFAI